MKCTAVFDNLCSCGSVVQYSTCLEDFVLAANRLDINLAFGLAIHAAILIAL